ncbi:hypothetical protein BD847_1981 [Flavobacterium cutihirudinis]|uniref:Uncharacterized protein n=1 Tax=Flavobacterium cutihirudinis TaxID=1265740 RepID=A0A3D9FWT8_9FLAO|nr:hypothetical protein [Flavobacterium cutihirudinis]RED25234.1 hypothetical protein BD847_1981 [Flavobacterium cutihirudinis]
MTIPKQKKTTFFIITLLSIIVLCSFINFRSIHVKFHNKTGEDIDSLVIAGTLIGNLKNGSSTEYINFKQFEFDGSIPYEQISGIISHKKVNQLNWSWCSTERNTQSKGSFIFDLKKDTRIKDTSYLYLVAHNQKIFWEEN